MLVLVPVVLITGTWATLLCLVPARTEKGRAEAREAARIAGVTGLLCVVVLVISFAIAMVRERAFERAIRAAVPIKAAIATFTERHGHPPESLDRLVPDLLETVPPTTLASAPRFEYESRDGDGTLFIWWGSDRYEF
ncbi:MAG: hypothetical protein AAF957_27315 [Planctomycetota bacterium]